MQRMLLGTLVVLLSAVSLQAQLTFSITVNNQANASVISLFVNNNTGGEATLVGFNAGIYIDGTETAYVTADFSPLMTLGWNIAGNSSVTTTSETISIPVTHDTRVEAAVFDGNAVGTTLNDGTTQLLMTLTFDNSAGTPNFGNEAYLASDAEAPAASFTYLDETFSPISLVTSGDTRVVLPLELLFFKAQRHNERSLLQWTTAWEQGTSHFELEHSTDGRQFRYLGTVVASGESVKEAEYIFWHQQPSLGWNYYRLRMVDKDESWEYSPVASLQYTDDEPVLVYPNPTVDRLRLQNVPENTHRLLLLNQLGQPVAQFGPVNELDVQAYLAGTYYLTGHDVQGKTLWTRPVVKQ